MYDVSIIDIKMGNLKVLKKHVITLDWKVLLQINQK